VFRCVLAGALLLAACGVPSQWKTWERDCSAGDPQACYQIADAHGPFESYQRKVWYLREDARRFDFACQRGIAAACLRLADVIAIAAPGHIDPIYNHDGATAALARACGLGSLEGCRRVSTDKKGSSEELPWRERACQLGDADACERAAELLARGQGGDADAARGLDRLERMCAGGRSSACRLVGQIEAGR
jgi:TPR repeat protein